jgi:hypothetical protein
LGFNRYSRSKDADELSTVRASRSDSHSRAAARASSLARAGSKGLGVDVDIRKHFPGVVFQRTPRMMPPSTMEKIMEGIQRSLGIASISRKMA